MFKPSELKVKPVRRYRAPRYPSHGDPDPTLYPQPVPYPAGRKFLAAVASAGIVTTASCNRQASDSFGIVAPEAAPLAAVKPVASHEVAPDADARPQSPQNPFRVEISGLPHRTSSYGTGVPRYIEADLARRAIERTFRKAGYRFGHNQPYDRDGMEFVVDGYDAEKRVGYVFAGWDTLDSDAALKWWVQTQPDGTLSAKTQIDLLHRYYKDDPTAKDLIAEIEAAQQMTNPAEQEAAFRTILDQHGRERLSLEEIKRLEDRAAEEKEFIAVISKFDTRFAREAWDWTSRPREVEAIEKIPDPAKRELARRELKEKMAREVIEKLETAVREYIDWARSQGAG